MARPDSWQGEIRDATRREPWALYGPNRVVKVVPLGRPLAAVAAGYVCLEKSLVGKTPQDIETSLGIKFRSLKFGCRIYRLTRLPTITDFDYELTADRPDGLAFNQVMHSGMYPPGDSAIHQWRLRIDIPAAHLADLMPGQKYGYSRA